MPESRIPARRDRHATLRSRALSAAALPIAPLYGAALAYRAFHPRRRVVPAEAGHPRDHGLPCTEVKVPFRAGRYVHAWLCPGSPERVVVLGHGMGASKVRSLEHAKFLHEAGYTVCLFDHRNHGASSQDASWRGLGDRFASDITAVVGHLRRVRGYGDARFAIYGFSFSCFSSMWALTHSGFEVDAMVCDSGPGHDVPPLFRKFLEADELPMPGPLGGEPSRAVVTGVLCALGTAMIRAQWPPPVTGKFARIPLLFMSGERDAIVPPSSVDALAERFPQAETHVLPGAEHLLGLRADPETYANVVLDFLKRALG
ncbi:alpha/beta fold hydrolase [Streptomyces sp. LX-29]|uniref:alpha/beta hydrolase n=1 Tax=Streptomyces sp. LX-29 TaxID=2900152 RepID=UPI00240D1812|nr:alpha/beta fold hydrolase [Streptomyces sp. LX-29]WFB09328.1 alpha/beta fold hydrolase [Streptomyces sp. LX-29]